MSATAANRARVLGCGIDRLDTEATLKRCQELIEAGGPAHQVSVNAAKLIAVRDNDRLRKIVERCQVVSADGQAVVWASRLLGDPLPERVAGIDLMERLLQLAEQVGYRVFLLGARPDVLEQAVAELRHRYPLLRIAGYRHGYFSDEDEPSIVEEVRAADPQILFVAISSPRKEYWIAEHEGELGVPLLMGVGGALDVIAGVTRRAPPLVQRLGLEWLFRLLEEPRRLSGRYLRTNAHFIVLVMRELVGRGRAQQAR